MSIDPNEILSEDWLIENLPDGWSYDCQPFGDDPAFIIIGPDRSFFRLPLRLLKPPAERVSGDERRSCGCPLDYHLADCPILSPGDLNPFDEQPDWEG